MSITSQFMIDALLWCCVIVLATGDETRKSGKEIQDLV